MYNSKRENERYLFLSDDFIKKKPLDKDENLFNFFMVSVVDNLSP